MPRKKSTRSKGSGNAEVAIAEPIEGLPEGLTTGDLVESYTQMLLVRTMDERIWALVFRRLPISPANGFQARTTPNSGSLSGASITAHYPWVQICGAWPRHI